MYRHYMYMYIHGQTYIIAGCPENNFPCIVSQFAMHFLYDCYIKYLLCSSFPSWIHVEVCRISFEIFIHRLKLLIKFEEENYSLLSKARSPITLWEMSIDIKIWPLLQLLLVLKRRGSLHFTLNLCFLIFQQFPGQFFLNQLYFLL